MKLHEREEIVRVAELALREAVHTWCNEHGDDLTTGEELRVVQKVLSVHLSTMAKYMIREERHGDTGTPGGLE